MRISIPVLPAVVRWLVVVLLAGGLMAGSLVAGASPGVGGPGGFPYDDEAQHIVAYGALALSITYAWLPKTPHPLRRGAWIFAIVFAYGALIEGLQWWVPTRNPDVGDLAADLIGASSAFVWDALVARYVGEG